MSPVKIKQSKGGDQWSKSTIQVASRKALKYRKPEIQPWPIATHTLVQGVTARTLWIRQSQAPTSRGVHSLIIYLGLSLKPEFMMSRMKSGVASEYLPGCIRLRTQIPLWNLPTKLLRRRCNIKGWLRRPIILTLPTNLQVLLLRCTCQVRKKLVRNQLYIPPLTS